MFLSSEVRCFSRERALISMSKFTNVSNTSVKKVWGWAVLGQTRCSYFSCCSEGSISDVESTGAPPGNNVAPICAIVSEKNSLARAPESIPSSPRYFTLTRLRRRSVTLTLPQGDHSLKRNSRPHNKKELLGNCDMLLK